MQRDVSNLYFEMMLLWIVNDQKDEFEIFNE